VALIGLNPGEFWTHAPAVIGLSPAKLTKCASGIEVSPENIKKYATGIITTGK
jgi:hypothetical protein